MWEEETWAYESDGQAVRSAGLVETLAEAAHEGHKIVVVRCDAAAVVGHRVLPVDVYAVKVVAAHEGDE